MVGNRECCKYALKDGSTDTIWTRLKTWGMRFHFHRCFHSDLKNITDDGLIIQFRNISYEAAIVEFHIKLF